MAELGADVGVGACPSEPSASSAKLGAIVGAGIGGEDGRAKQQPQELEPQ